MISVTKKPANTYQYLLMDSKAGNGAKKSPELCSKKGADTMIHTLNKLQKLAFLCLFIAFSCSSRLKVETILKDRLNFVPIKVNEGKYSCTGLKGSVKYGQQKKPLLQLYSVKKTKVKY